jgi:hypothetical protein
MLKFVGHSFETLYPEEGWEHPEGFLWDHVDFKKDAKVSIKMDGLWFATKDLCALKLREDEFPLSFRALPSITARHQSYYKGTIIFCINSLLSTFP